ncbi:MAG: hypothetical protein KH100_03385 [Dysgonomonas mossii]|uniref:hypothetical protein n=1 Tax=Dysgonomonas mossii TaxID=163665 RepID=UPI001E06A9DA|nr:hypothetical protein [Dysgonomonas mossii]MBS5796337.1 hypothetical protein [Dysgonomonas mossii]MBS7110232.1 hypothetical protein [Dysgonomonas mossii]
MIVNNLNNKIASKPLFSESGKSSNIYEKSLIDTVPLFRKALINNKFNKKLNENNYTQIFIICLNNILSDFPLQVIGQYSEIINQEANPQKSVDFAFVPREKKSIELQSLYCVEAKRLPTGDKDREKEYIWGKFKESGSPSGGILRFKTGDHGVGLLKNALIGYVEENMCENWFSIINKWINEKVKEDSDWDNEEQLCNFQNHPINKYSTAYSTVKRKSEIVDLLHLWIDVKELKI